jgi:hypothetical protein
VYDFVRKTLAHDTAFFQASLWNCFPASYPEGLYCWRCWLWRNDFPLSVIKMPLCYFDHNWLKITWGYEIALVAGYYLLKISKFSMVWKIPRRVFIEGFFSVGPSLFHISAIFGMLDGDSSVGSKINWVIPSRITQDTLHRNKSN